LAKKSKWTHPRGDINKRIVLDLVNNYPIDGISQPDIIEKLKLRHIKLSRQTISKILKNLVTEREIFKRKRKYLSSSDDQVNINLLAASINIELRRRLLSDNRGNGLPNLLYQSSLTAENLAEKSIFEFANLVGAFIVYLLIESMRPGEVSQKYKENINLLGHLVQNSIPLDELAKKFRQSLGISATHNEIYSDLENVDFARVSQAFMKVYPDIHNDLDKGWESMCELILTSRNDNKQKYCHHEWDERYLYKYGKYYQCRKCYYKTITKKK
jgi:hypothetical protein